jgi:hypothetical protein
MIRRPRSPVRGYSRGRLLPARRRRSSILQGTQSGRREPGYQGHVRPNGRAGSPASRRPRGHVCCLYDDVADFRRPLAAFFAAGLRAGCRVAYAGLGGVEGSRADLAGLPDLDRRLADGSVQPLSLQDVYGDAHPVDRHRVVDLYAAATEQALADGFRGLRVGADGSELVRSPAHLGRAGPVRVPGRPVHGWPCAVRLPARPRAGDPERAGAAARHRLVGGNGLHALRLRGRRHRPRGAVRPDQRHGAPAAPDPHPGGSRRRDRRHRQGRRRVRRPPTAATLSAHAREQGVALSPRSAPPFAARLMELLAASCLQHSEEGADA